MLMSLFIGSATRQRSLHLNMLTIPVLGIHTPVHKALKIQITPRIHEDCTTDLDVCKKVTWLYLDNDPVSHYVVTFYSLHLWRNAQCFCKRIAPDEESPVGC